MHRQLFVAAPSKSEASYVFNYDIKRPISGSRDLLVRGRHAVTEGGSLRSDRRRFGFVATNFNIPHSTFWDTAYPLLHLTRQAGPLFGQGCSSAEITFEYEFDDVIAAFFVKRAQDLGIELRIDGPGVAAAEPRRSSTGTVVAFGGGKDSRLLLGLLGEFGEDPQPFQAGFPIGMDIANLRVSESVSLGLADHVMPGLMCADTSFYFGSGIGEAHRTQPWHRHFDFGSPRAIAQLGGLMSSFGTEIDCQSPLAALPYNLIQKILADRFPRLHAFQHSVVPNEKTEKNLHVALCRLYHGLDVTETVSTERFKALLRTFVNSQIIDPEDFGFRDYRLPIRLEMRSIVWRLRDHALFADVAGLIPEEWDGEWIDHVHPYVVPGLDPRFAEVFSEYADDVPVRLFHIPT